MLGVLAIRDKRSSSCPRRSIPSDIFCTQNHMMTRWQVQKSKGHESTRTINQGPPICQHLNKVGSAPVYFAPRNRHNVVYLRYERLCEPLASRALLPGLLFPVRGVGKISPVSLFFFARGKKPRHHLNTPSPVPFSRHSKYMQRSLRSYITFLTRHHVPL